MLGLGSSCNSEESYAKGERYRERFHTGSTYHTTTNPIGRKGKESDWIGQFSSSSDDDNFVTSDGLSSIISGVLRLRVSADNGFVSIAVSTVPGVTYTISYLNDPDDATNGDAIFKVGTTAGGHDIVKTSIFAATSANTTKSLTFIATQANTYISWSVNLAGRQMWIDNISFKEA